MCRHVCENSEHSEQMQHLEEQIAVSGDGDEPRTSAAAALLDDNTSSTPTSRSRNPSRFSVDGETDIIGESGSSSMPTSSRYLDADPPIEHMRFIILYKIRAYSEYYILTSFI